jgi:sec-independent protein translocase protein TatB
MFDIGWTELLVIAIVLIVVVGPKDLPPMLRAFGKTTANLRKMAGEFRAQFDEALRESELDDVRRTISDAQRLNPTNALREAINPLRQMGQEIRNDLQKATQVPTESESAKTDIEAQQAIEGASEDASSEISAPEPSAPAATAPASNLTAAPVVSVASRPLTSDAAQPAPAAVGPAAPVASKPKRATRKASPAQPSAELASAETTVSEPAKPKRARVKPKAAPAAETAGEPAAAATPRRRVVKKTDTPKDDA